MCKFRINRHALESSHRINVDFPHGMNIQCGKSTFILCGLSNACRLMRNFHIHSKIFFESVKWAIPFLGHLYIKRMLRVMPLHTCTCNEQGINTLWCYLWDMKGAWCESNGRWKCLTLILMNGCHKEKIICWAVQSSAAVWSDLKQKTTHAQYITVERIPAKPKGYGQLAYNHGTE